MFLSSKEIDFLKTPAQFMKGVGPHYAQQLKALGLETFWDILCQIPLRYKVYKEDPPEEGKAMMFCLQVTCSKGGGFVRSFQKSPELSQKFSQKAQDLSPWDRSSSFVQGKRETDPMGQKVWRVSMKILGEHEGEKHQEIDLVFFKKPKIPFIKGTLWHGRGLVEKSVFGGWQIIHPSTLIPQEKAVLWGIHRRAIEPLYENFPKSVSCWRVGLWVSYILNLWPKEGKNQQYFPISGDGALVFKKDLWDRAHRGFDLSLRESFLEAHHPGHLQQIQGSPPWKKRLAWEEMLAQHLSQISIKEQAERAAPLLTKSPLKGQEESLIPDNALEVMLKNFSHPLTPSQQQAWREIEEDLNQSKPMMRLLHGDVGSGKTIVAFLSLIKAVQGGYQACLMAPTETLIRQHYALLCQWIPEKIKVGLFLGGKKHLGEKNAQIILGTHALFYEGVSFQRLGLVVIDEQHRFGVLQRLALCQKNGMDLAPHLLCLSATPIPRTFQRALWGHMDVSLLESRPHKASFHNYLISLEKIDQLEKWIQKEIGQGRGTYWVCPSIEDEEQGVKARFVYWQKRFPEKVGLLHGKMKAKEKNEVIEAFRKKDILLLVSTTVIEVGIHVGHASTMIIEESPRFGLAQLHQLRGRVGREDWDGHCFFLYTPPLHRGSFARLDMMRKCNNGFQIAEYDWKTRGSGVLLGTQQSGRWSYRFFSPEDHGDLVESAYAQAKILWQTSPLLGLKRASLFGYEAPDILQAG